MNSKTYTVAGTSNHNGIVKARFANSLEGRVTLLTKAGDTDINLITLPNAMTKDQASEHLATVYVAGSPEHEAVTAKLARITVSANRSAKRNAVTGTPTKSVKPAKTAKVVAKASPVARVRPSRSKAAIAARQAVQVEQA